MQKGLILEFDRVEKKKGYNEERDVRVVSRLLLFLPKLILIALIAPLLAGSVYLLVQYYFTAEIPYFLPEASQVINFVRSGTGLLALGTVLTIILFVFVLRGIFEKKNEILNDEQADEAETSKMFQAMLEIEECKTSEQVVPLPIKKKAIKKIYGKCREQEKTKNEEKFRKKNKTNNKRRGYYPDNNSGQRGNVVMFKQKRPSFQRRASRPITPRVAAAVNRIKWGTQTQTVNQTL
jgi:hypothetical protein